MIPIAWKIGGGIAVAVSLGLGISLLKANGEIAAQSRQITTLQTNLNTCGANVVTLQTAVDEQNRKITDLNTSLTKATEIAKQQIRVAQDARRRADKAALRFTPPKGDTLEVRVLDVDARIMEKVR